MPDGTDQGSVDAADQAAVAADGRLVAGVGRRLVLWAAGTTLLVLIGLGIALYVAVSSSLQSSGIKQLDNRIDALSGPGPRPGEGELPAGFIFGGGSSGTFAIVLDKDGNVLQPRDPDLPDGMPDTASLAAAISGGRDVRVGTVETTPVRILTRPVESRVGTVYVQVYQDRTAEERTLTVLVGMLLLGGLVVLLVAAAVGTVYSRRALVPIRESLTSQRRALRRQREFAADASHELRTPLTVVRASVEYLRRHGDQKVSEVGDALVDIDAEVDHLTHLVEDLLLLARSDSGAVSIEKARVDMGDIAADAATSLAKTASERGITITVDPEPAPLLGDAARLRQLVLILVDNALGHSPRGGNVGVVARRDGDRVRLVVEDDGPGLSDAELPRVFERFWRGSGAPPGGAGLGLSIANWIVTAHGGTISAANRAPSGARFTVELPTTA